MGSAGYISEVFKQKQTDAMRYILRIRAWEYRQLPKMVRLSHPSNPVKARALGYKAKQGYVVVRIRTRKHSMKRDAVKGKLHRKPKNTGVYVKNDRSTQTIAETRVCKEHPNLRILGSYWVAEDGTYKFFEVLLADPFHNAIRNDGKMNWICEGKHKRKDAQGLTSSGRKSRGLRGRGVKYDKNRPSKRANKIKKQVINLRKKR